MNGSDEDFSQVTDPEVLADAVRYRGVTGLTDAQKEILAREFQRLTEMEEGMPEPGLRASSREGTAGTTSAPRKGPGTAPSRLQEDPSGCIREGPLFLADSACDRL